FGSGAWPVCGAASPGLVPRGDDLEVNRDAMKCGRGNVETQIRPLRSLALPIHAAVKRLGRYPGWSSRSKAGLVQPSLSKKRVPIRFGRATSRVQLRRHRAEKKQCALHIELDGYDA